MLGLATIWSLGVPIGKEVQALLDAHSISIGDGAVALHNDAGIPLRSRFLTPPAVADHRNAPVNALGYLRVMFAAEDIDETLERLRKRGAQLVGEVVQYKDAYRLCYIRGPEGLLIGLAQEIR